MSVIHIELTNQVIDVSCIETKVSHPHAGGEVLFLGTTRSWTANRQQPDLPGAETEYLFYEAHESMAQKQMHEIALLAQEKWSLLAVAIVHRLGKVMPQEASVAIAVSCPHRAEAFDAARWIIDQVKHEVPIWKQEHYKGAPPEWVHDDDAKCCSGTPQDSNRAIGLD